MYLEEGIIAEQESIDVGGSDAETGAASEAGSNGLPEAVEDRPVPVPTSLAEARVFWDEIIISVIVIVGAIVIYFVIRYFLNRAADSLQLERGQAQRHFLNNKANSNCYCDNCCDLSILFS
jgi:hypothetical protein